MFAALKALFTRPTSAGPVTSVAYSSFPSIPSGSVNVAMTAGAGNAIISGTTMQEGNSATSGTNYDSALVLPDALAITTTVSVTVTVGALSVAANNRFVGAAIFSADGSKGIYVRFASKSGTASLQTFQSGTSSVQKTSTQVATAGDTITLTGTLSAGVWTWTVKKNSGADIAALTFTDSSHVIDLPGNHPAIYFRHVYSGGQFPSRGVSALSAVAA